MEEDGGEPPQLPRPTSSKAPISEPHLDPQSTCPESTLDPSEDDRTDSKPTLLNQTELFRALEVVERDSLAIADSFTSLFASLRLALSELITCIALVKLLAAFNNLGDNVIGFSISVLDAATKGNRYVNSCPRLNEEMKGAGSLALQLKILRRDVDALDSGENKLLRLP